MRCHRILIVGIVLLLPAFPVYAKKKEARRTAKVTAVKSGAKLSSADGVFERIKQKYVQKEISKTTFWAALQRLDKHETKLSNKNRADKLQLQAELLLDDNYPIAATLIALDALKQSKQPFTSRMSRAWSVIKSTARDHSIQSLLDDVALDIHRNGVKVPVLGNDWYYFAGNAYVKKGDRVKARQAYKRLRMSDRYFLPGKYQQALVHVEENDLTQAESVLKMLTQKSAKISSELSQKQIIAIQNYAHLALGRIYYEQKRFKEATLQYRSVDRDSLNFYDALFEQSWALFMAGYPNHALGALHSVDSPFYKQVYNPESLILRSVVYYWMCRYDDSRNALASFSEKYSATMDSLQDFLDRKRLSPNMAYRMFENLVSGVSQASLGIDVAVLQSAAEKDSMLLLREEFASALKELDRLEARGVLRLKHNNRLSTRPLRQYVNQLKDNLGTQLIAELKTMKKDFDQLYDQAQFLYLELLMSEKEQLLGRNLHASSKLNRVSLRRNIGVWGRDVQSWAADDKDEYWWDEIGFYIYREPSMCSN